MPVSRRIELQNILTDILGSNNVYFQPPVNLQIKYPCFIYHRSGVDDMKADNIGYLVYPEYEIMYIDPDPDAGLTVVEKIFARLPSARYGRHYVADSLNHEVMYVNF